MRKITGAIALSLLLAGCGGVKPPSDADALEAIRHGSFDGALGEELRRYAFLEAKVLNCELGKRGEQSVGLCDLCVTMAGNRYRWIADVGTTNKLQAAKGTIRVTLSNALSYDSPDVSPDRPGDGVWIAAPIVEMSPDYKTDGSTFDMPAALMARLAYPTDRAFSGLEEYDAMLKAIEAPEISSAIRSQTGACTATKRAPAA